MWFLKQNKMTAFYTGQQCSRVSRLFSAKHLTLIVIRLNGHNSWLQVLRLRIFLGDQLRVRTTIEPLYALDLLDSYVGWAGKRLRIICPTISIQT